MEKRKKPITLAAKVIGGIAFLVVFILNMAVFVQKDSTSGDLSLLSSKAYAQPEEDPTKDLFGANQSCTYYEVIGYDVWGDPIYASYPGNVRYCYWSPGQHCEPRDCG